MKINDTYTKLIKGKQVTFRYNGSARLPLFSLVTSVSVIPFTKDGNIVAVRLRHRGLDLPGGHVESLETTPEQTMRREVMEEACMTIKNPILAEVIESDYFDRASYMLIYGAFADELFPFDTPNHEMSDKREIVNQDDFIRQYEAGDKELMRHVIQSAWQKLSNLS